MNLPPPLDKHYAAFANAIRARLAEFCAPKTEEDIFYEFCYCLCTPQSKARHAMRVVECLRAERFFEHPVDPTPVLADRNHYVRFHRTKAKRLLRLHSQFSAIVGALSSIQSARDLRRWIVKNVAGFGMKEASHVLRNLGRFELAIVDRHVLRNLCRFGAIDTNDFPRTERHYEQIENAFCNFAAQCGLPLQELDLLLWAIETGEVLK